MADSFQFKNALLHTIHFSFLPVRRPLYNTMPPIHSPTPLATLAGLIVRCPNDVYKLVADGAKNKVVDRHTLPMLLQQVLLQHKPLHKGDIGGSMPKIVIPSWRLGLEVLRAPAVASNAIRLDEGMWATLHKTCPCDKSKQACSNVLAQLYQRANRQQ